MIETLLYNKLKAITANVYPLVAPTNYETPAIIYNRIGMDPTRTVDDDPQTEGWVDFQVDTYSPRFLEAKTVGRQVTNLLKAWKDSDVRSASWTEEEHTVDDTTAVDLYRVRIQMRFYTTDL